MQFLSELMWLSSAIALGLSLTVHLRWKDRVARTLALYLLGVTLVCFAYASELFSGTLPVKTAWVSLRYIGWALQLTSLPFFIHRYSRGPDRWLRAFTPLLVGVPLLVTAVQVTNPLHHLFYPTVWLDTGGPIPMFAKTTSWLYYAYQAYATLLFLGSAVLLVRRSAGSKGLYRSQAALFVSGLLVTVLADLLYLLGVRPYSFFNLTPLSFLLSGALFTLALFRYRMLEVGPIGLQLAFSRIPVAILVVDSKGYVADMNLAAQTLLHLPRAYTGGRSLEEVCRAWPGLAEQVRELPDGASRQLRRMQEQSEHVYSVEVSTLDQGARELVGRLVLVREITAEVQLHQTQLEHQRALASLQEREHLARELHDSLGQVIGFLNLETRAAVGLLQTGQTGLLQAKLERMSEVAGAAQVDLRELLLGMHQGFSAALDFFQALEKYANEYSRLYGLQIHLSLPERSAAPALSPAVEVHLLRLIQEALSNVRKHARATQARILFTFDAGEARVVIEDDGQGFAPGAPDREGTEPHFGLQMMRERVSAMQGSLQLISAPGQGTRVIITVPLEAAPARPSQASAWRVVLADDHPLFRDGLRNLLLTRGVEVLGAARDGAEAVEMVQALQPDIAILDIQMPGMDGIQAAAEIRKLAPRVRILMLTMAADQATLARAVQAGASGYLLKSLKAEDFLARLDALMAGEVLLPAQAASQVLEDLAGRAQTPDLNDRQVEVLRLLAQNLTYAQIAERLYLSESTIKYHVAQVIEILGVANRKEALAEAARFGWIDRRRPGR